MIPTIYKRYTMAPFENTRSRSMSSNDFKIVLECKDVGNLPDVLDPCFALRDHFQTRGLIGNIRAIFSNGSEMVFGIDGGMDVLTSPTEDQGRAQGVDNYEQPEPQEVKDEIASVDSLEITRLRETVAELEVTKEEEELLTKGKPMVEKVAIGVTSIPFGLLTR